MELYIDMIFLVSWSMNAFLLWEAGRIAGFSAKKWRIFLGGFLSAAIYCLWLICLRRNGGDCVLSVFAVDGLICGISSQAGAKLAAAVRRGGGGFFSAGRHGQCAFYNDAGAKDIRAGNGCSEGVSLVAAALGNRHSISFAEMGGKVAASPYRPQAGILHSGSFVARKRHRRADAH